MKIRNLALIQAAVLAVMVPVCINMETVSAEDYCIELTMETMEIPINYIESNRIVYVPVNVNNNPGIESLSFVIEKDERITNDVYAVRYSDFPFGIELQSVSHKDDRYIGVQAGCGFGDYYYDTNGFFCSLEVTLPQNYSIGDFYSINFYPDEVEGQRSFYFEKNNNKYGKECFSYVNGGIKIVEAVSYGNTPELPTPTETETPVINNQPPQNQQETPQNNSQETQNQNNNNNGNHSNSNNSSNNNNNTLSGGNSSQLLITESIVSTAVTSTAVTGTTTVSSDTKTTAQNNVSKTTVTKNTTKKRTTKESVTETDQTDVVATVAKTKKSRNYAKIVLGAIITLALLAIGAAVIIKKKKK